MAPDVGDHRRDPSRAGRVDEVGAGSVEGRLGTAAHQHVGARLPPSPWPVRFPATRPSRSRRGRPAIPSSGPSSATRPQSCLHRAPPICRRPACRGPVAAGRRAGTSNGRNLSTHRHQPQHEAGSSTPTAARAPPTARRGHQHRNRWGAHVPDPPWEEELRNQGSIQRPHNAKPPVVEPGGGGEPTPGSRPQVLSIETPGAAAQHAAAAIALPAVRRPLQQVALHV